MGAQKETTGPRPAVDISVGSRIRSRKRTNYRILQRLGQGGNASVYLATAGSGEHRGVLFALKVFTRVTNEERLERFLEEIEVLREFSHPSIMRIYDSGNYDKYPFVVAEYLPRTLRAALKAGTLSMVERTSYTLQLLSALSFLSTRNPVVVHRDIKPDNIMIKGHSCVLGDFGLMKLLDETSEDGESAVVAMKDSAGPGMPRSYRTPDLVAYARKESSITAKSDVFQLGLVIAEMFTGRSPLRQCKDMLDPIVLDELLPMPGKFGDKVLPLILQMLEMDPKQRSSALEMMDSWEGVFQEMVQHVQDIEGKVF